MKFKIPTILISIAISALIAYGFYALGQDTEQKILLTIIVFIFSVIMLSGSISVVFPYERTTAVIRSTSISFFFLGLGFLICCSVFNVSLPIIFIVIGILTLIYFLVVYGVSNSKH